MKNTLFIISVILLILSCGKKNSQNEVSNDSIISKDEVVVDTTNTQKILDNENSSLSYKFSSPDSNFVYFSTIYGIYRLNEFAGKIDTVLKIERLEDFFISEYGLIYATSNDNVISFYKKNKNSTDKIFDLNTEKTIKKYYEPQFSDDESVSFGGISIVDSYDGGESFKFEFYYYPDWFEGPYTPTWQFEVHNFGDSVSINEVEYISQDFYRALDDNTIFKKIYYEEGKGYVFNDKILLADSVGDGAFNSDIAYNASFSPDSSMLLFIVEKEWLEGLIYSYYLINLKNYEHINLNMDGKFMWIDSNKLLYSPWNLVMITPDFEKFELSDKAVRKYMPKHLNKDKIMFNIYAE